MRACRLSSVFVLAAAALAVMYGQSDSGHASIQGRVTDSSGKVITGAEVTVRETQTGFVRKLATDAEGHYLARGVFAVEAAAPGFGLAKVTGVLVTVGETKSVNISLHVAAVSTE